LIQVAPELKNEQAIYENIDFQVSEYMLVNLIFLSTHQIYE